MTASLKKGFFQQALDTGSVVMLHLDPRVEGVVVPEHLKKDAVLRLNFAWGFNLPVFSIGDEDILVMLSFNSQNFRCTLPWKAVFAITRPDQGHEGVTFPDSFPAELLQYVKEPEPSEALSEEELVSLVTEAQEQLKSVLPFKTERKILDKKSPRKASDKKVKTAPKVGLTVVANDNPEISAPRRGHLKLVRD